MHLVCRLAGGVADIALNLREIRVLLARERPAIRRRLGELESLVDEHGTTIAAGRGVVDNDVGDEDEEEEEPDEAAGLESDEDLDAEFERQQAGRVSAPRVETHAPLRGSGPGSCPTRSSRRQSGRSRAARSPSCSTGARHEPQSDQHRSRGAHADGELRAAQHRPDPAAHWGFARGHPRAVDARAGHPAREPGRVPTGAARG